MVDRYLEYLLKKSFVTKARDLTLFGLTFDDSVGQKESDAFFCGFDIEKEPHEFNVYLSNLISVRKDITLPENVLPRLSGLRRWHQFHNVTLLSEYAAFAKILAESKIPVVLIKGAAIRFYLPHIVRHMWDLDCFVLPENYEQAIQLATKKGWKILGQPDHSCDLEKGTCHLDIHKGYSSNRLAMKVLKSSRELNQSGALLKVPRLEDLILITILNAYKNFSEKYSYHSNMTWAFDLAFISEKNKDINWVEILESAEEENVEYKLWVVLSLFARAAPQGRFQEIRRLIPQLKRAVIEKGQVAEVCSSIAGREALEIRDKVKLDKKLNLAYIKNWLIYSTMRLSQKRRLPAFVRIWIAEKILQKTK